MRCAINILCIMIFSFIVLQEIFTDGRNLYPFLFIACADILRAKERVEYCVQVRKVK